MKGSLVAATLDACRLLTVLPVPGRAPSAGAGSGAFPLVGLLLGVLLLPLFLLPVAPLPTAALVATAWVLLTGGLHEDAWADVADASFAPGGPSRRREVLKDPRTGSHGTTAVALLLLLRVAALTSVPPVAVVVAPVVGRWAMVVVSRSFPPLPGAGFGAWFRRQARPGVATATAAAILAAVVAIGGAAPGRVVGASLAGVGAAGLLGALLSRRLGGLNGDGIGAAGAGGELVALWAFLPATGSWG